MESFTPRALSLDIGIKARPVSCFERVARICGDGGRQSLKLRRPVSGADVSGRVQLNTCRASFVRTYPRSLVSGSLCSNLTPIVYQPVSQKNPIIRNNGRLAHTVSEISRISILFISELIIYIGMFIGNVKNYLGK